MLKTKSFLCGDFGAGTLKLAEFEPNETGTLRLLRYAVKPLGLEGSQDSTRAAALIQALQTLLKEKGFVSRQINVCAAGYNVFSKFVKLPPVDAAKVTQIIQYEAQQNVPFPLEEVVWDYQILGANATGELEVLLVAIKSDTVEGLFNIAETSGLQMNLVDVSPAALCNAYRFNYGEQEGCTMLLDIGAKTSNVLFFEKGKVFSRSINIGANAITQDFANEARLQFDEADRIKIEQGFVSLGGAYEEPDNPHQAAISKIARQVMTRLHIQMNQTIQFYRNNQGGSAPARLYLAGGASMMPYAAQFFAEKLNIPVDYFNPLQNVEYDPSISLEELATVAHSFGEVVGLGVRNLAQCPVELNLMPKSHLKRKAFDQKKPWLMAALFSLVLVVFSYGLFYKQQAGLKNAEIKKLNERINPLRNMKGQLDAQFGTLKTQYQLANEHAMLLDDRYYTPQLMNSLQSMLLQYEASSSNAFGKDTGVWIEKFTPLLPTGAAPVGGGGRFGPAGGAPAAPGQPVATPLPTPAAPVVVGYYAVTFRAANLNSLAPDANRRFAFALQEVVKTNTLFLPDYTKLDDKMEEVDPAAKSFSFSMTLQLKRPVRLH
ncbi:MAG TPA: type IV pilus assembly protein PilM [Verrucomicrobiae bacterium]